MQKTQTQVKPAAKQTQKAAPKAKPAAVKTASKAKTLVYKVLLAEALAGKFGAAIQRFYVNAISYHEKAKTVFPRARIAGEKLMDEKEAREFIAKHEKTSIPPGNKAGQRLFDEMMVQTASK